MLCGQNTWTLLDDHVPAPRHLDREAALTEIARRFLTARGPATERDLAWWTGLKLTDARAAIATVDDEFDRLDVDGVTYHLRTRAGRGRRRGARTSGLRRVRLGLRRSQRAAGGPPPHERGARGQRDVSSTIVVNGEIVGTWRRVTKAKAVHITAEAFGALTRDARTGFERAARAYGDYLGLPVVFAA